MVIKDHLLHRHEQPVDWSESERQHSDDWYARIIQRKLSPSGDQVGHVRLYGHRASTSQSAAKLLLSQVGRFSSLVIIVYIITCNITATAVCCAFIHTATALS
jgi:hypothetical protein